MLKLVCIILIANVHRDTKIIINLATLRQEDTFIRNSIK